MTTFHDVLELEIQKREVQVKRLQTEIKTLREIQSTNVPGRRTTKNSSNKLGRSAPHHVRRPDAELGFRRSAVAFTTRELSREIRGVVGAVVTPGCAYNWLRNFRAEELVTQGPRAGKFGHGTWHKTEKGLTPRWHDRAQPPAV